MFYNFERKKDMDMNAELLQMAKPFIDSLLENIVKPKVKEFSDKCKLEYEKNFVSKWEHFGEYLYRTYKKYSIVNTLALKNQQKFLKNIYVPLTLETYISDDTTHKKYKMEQFPSEMLQEYSGRLLITDTAGMGKSTLMKRMFIDVIENGYGVPIYIELRRLSKERTILKEIHEQINSISKEFDEDLLLEFIQTGSFIFFLDGYDEISSDNRVSVTSDIQTFVSKAFDNSFILTSRPESALASFGEFQKATIVALTKKEAYELLRKYDNGGEVSRLLIEKLRSGEYSMIDEFLRNPLLVSLLYAAFDHKQTIPLKKHIFYRQVYDAYFDAHDLSKGDSYTHEKKSKLDIDDFDRILRYIGFLCITKQKIEFEKDEILSIIDNAKNYCRDLDFSNSDFLEDILCRVPLFCKDGNYYKWVHKSLQEYFAARFINQDYGNVEEVLTRMFNSSQLDYYINMLDIYADLDAFGFKRNIVKPLLLDYVNFYEECRKTYSDLLSYDLDARISLLFMRIVYIVKVVMDSPREIFDYLDEVCPLDRINRRMVVRHYNKDFEGATMFGYDKKYCLLRLIALKYKHLCKPIRRWQIEGDESILFPESIAEVGIDSGKDDPILYSLYNKILLDRRDYFVLDYDSIKRELSNIESLLLAKGETSLLLESI